MSKSEEPETTRHDEDPRSPAGRLPDRPDPATARKIEDLPREVGVMLVSVGVLGIALPGMAGAPAVLAGGLVLWPGTFGKVEGWFHRRFPELHQRGMQQVGRYLNDLERRFPDLTRS